MMEPNRRFGDGVMMTMTREGCGRRLEVSDFRLDCDDSS